MPSIEQRISIDAPTDRVWSALSDFGGIDRWSPVINHSASVDGTERGVGPERACKVKGLFPDVVKRTMEWDEGHGYSFEIEGAPMLRKALSTWSIEATGDSTIVTARLEYQTSMGPIGALMGATIMKRMMNGNLRESLAGLKHHVETGDLITDRVPAKQARGASPHQRRTRTEAPGDRGLCSTCSASLVVEVELEFVRRRPLALLRDLVPLEPHPRIQNVLREDIAL